MSARFARQISLAEIGTAGQERIAGATVRAGGGDPRAVAVALDYLERAGVRVEAGGDPVDVPDVVALAGRAELVEAAVFLAGSLAATERLAKCVGIETRVARVPTLAISTVGSSEP